jgi:hypothetical protein
VNSLVALLLMNLLMLSERHLEALHVFEQHRSVLVRDKDIVTLAAIGLYKTGTPEALRQVRPSSQKTSGSLQCCGSGMFIPDPDFYPSRIKTKERGGKNLLSYLFCSHKYHKIENYFIFELMKKKLGPFTKNYRTFYPNNCH